MSSTSYVHGMTNQAKCAKRILRIDKARFQNSNMEPNYGMSIFDFPALTKAELPIRAFTPST